MAETIHFELVSPTAKLAATEADSVTLPAAEGEMTAMASHAPFLSALRPGVITVSAKGGEARYVVTGGFVEVTPGEVGVIAEDALEADKVERAWLDAQAEAAEAAAADMADDDERKLAAAQRAMDLRALPALLNL
ncbi:MAG: ATP synthase F1 subunit epsilon [Pseudomonadota bacterium]